MSALQLGDKYEGGIYAGMSTDGEFELILSSRIISNLPLSHGVALTACKEYSGPGGFEDWDLPTLEDLEGISKSASRERVPLRKAIGCSDDKVFWTSVTSALNAREAYVLELRGLAYLKEPRSKRNHFYVKAIRRVPVTSPPIPSSVDLNEAAIAKRVTEAVAKAVAEKDRTIRELSALIDAMRETSTLSSKRITDLSKEVLKI